MDEVGLMVTGIDDKGYLTYDTCGGIDPRVIVSKRVLVGEKAVPGVIGAKPIHLQSKSEFESVMKHDSLVIDIGAKDKADAERPGEQGRFRLLRQRMGWIWLQGWSRPRRWTTAAAAPS